MEIIAPGKKLLKDFSAQETRDENMIAYTEKPASNRYVHANSSSISADNLFSLFTAEVIREDTLFVR